MTWRRLEPCGQLWRHPDLAVTAHQQRPPMRRGAEQCGTALGPQHHRRRRQAVDLVDVRADQRHAAHDRTRASGLAIALWFGFVLVFDLLLLNPTDVFRNLNQPLADGRRDARLDRRTAGPGELEIPMTPTRCRARHAALLPLLALVATLAACSRAGEPAGSAALEIDRGTTCELDGMLLARPTIASFAQEPDAAAFVAQHGGRLLRYAEIKPEMVDLSGGAQHDQRM